MQEGKYVGKVIKAAAGRAAESQPFKYFDKGTMATIGYRSAVADAFGVKFTGFLGYLMWAFIHVAYLVGWGNRLGTMYTWARGDLVRAQPGAPDHHLRVVQQGPHRGLPALRPARSRPAAGQDIRGGRRSRPEHRGPDKEKAEHG